LVAGTLRILELEAVMPDCLVVAHGLRRDEEDLQVDLTAYVNQLRDKAMPVHLAVAARDSDYITKGDLARYASVEGDPVTDENTGEGRVRIPRLRARLSLLVTETPPKKYISFPLAKVVYKNEAFALTDYIPPSPAIAAQSPLGVLCSLTARRVREKAMFLAEQARTPSAGAGLRLDLETRNLIRSLVSTLPLLEALIYTGVSHPFQIYLALCAMAGQLSTLGTSLVPPVFAPYDHNDLLFTFKQVLDFIARMLDEGITSSYKVYPFHYKDGMYELMFDGEWMNKRLVIGMRGQAGMSEKDLSSWGEECLIGSQTRLQAMRENRVLGARREQIERDEDLVPSRGSVLFALKPDREFIEPNEVLQIFNKQVRDGGPRPSEIVMYVRNAA
ncbi:MAG TPA: type VI secretion system baseplate subunit TssK, partial [Pyrinomonadaceae bacterium]